MATLSVVICLVLAGLLVVRDSGGVPAAPSRWWTAAAVVEGLLWLSTVVVVAPTVWGLVA